jgi:Tol biopolymer transport system component
MTLADLRKRFESLSRTPAPDLWCEIEDREPRDSIEPPSSQRVLVAVVAFVVAIAGIGIAAVTFGGSDRPAAAPGGRIAFAALDGSTWQIYSVASNGSGLVQLTYLSDVEVASEPAWSPDGGRVAFVVQTFDENGGTRRADIWTMDADGSDPRQVTDGPGSSWSPSWSPDGTQIAYTRVSANRRDQIWIMDADGSNPHAFTHCGSECLGDSSPSWSPDGTQIAFVRRTGSGAIIPWSVNVWPVGDPISLPIPQIELDGATFAAGLSWSPDGSSLALETDSDGAGLYVADVEEERVRLLTKSPAPDPSASSWSPDGNHIVFSGTPVGSESATLYVADADGTKVREITGLPTNASWPAWQPIRAETQPEPPAPVGPMANGPIYFRVGGGDGGSRVESILSDGTGRHVVFPDDGPVHYSRIDFSPDGARIAFDNFLQGEYGIETADPDGTDVLRLTDGVNDSWASWSPDGTKILFSSTRYDPSIGQCTPGDPHEFGCPTDIYVMGADGSNVTRLTDDPLPEFMPVWSPDGSRIAFVREADPVPAAFTGIYTMNPDGSDVKRLSSSDGGSDFWPSWSPDGAQIVFAAIRREDWGIWTVDANGSNEQLILGGTGAGYVDNPVWSPDGSLIAFVGNMTVDDYSPEDALYVMRPDGTDVTPIADAPSIGVAGDIAWQPIQALAHTIGPITSIPPSTAEVIETFEVGVDVRSVVYGEGSVWVATSNDDGNEGGRIVRIDPGTHEIQADIPVEVIPGWEVGGGAMVVEGGSLWVTGGFKVPGNFDDPGGGVDAAVIRIDASTNRVVQTFNLGARHGADLTFLDGELWVLLFGDESVNDAIEVVRIDPATGDVPASYQLDANWAHTLVAANGRFVTAVGGDDSVNVDGRVIEIDPATGGVATVEIPSRFFTPMPVVWRGQVWISTDSGFVQFDPFAEGFAQPPVTLAPRFGDCCGFLEADDRGIWFLSPDLEGGSGRVLNVFDPTNGEATALATLNEGTPIAMAVGPDAVWVLNYEGTLTHVSLG